MYCYDNGMHEALPPSLYDLDSCFIVVRVALCGPGQRSGFSDSIRAERSGDRIPIFLAPPDRPWSPPSLLYNGYRVSFPGVNRLGRGVDHSSPSSAEVKERVGLYSYSPSEPSRSAEGQNLRVALYKSPEDIHKFIEARKRKSIC